MTPKELSTDPFPEALELIEGESVLLIRWDDGVESRHQLAELRAACPCAMCQGHQPSQSLNLQATQFPGIRISDLAPVGRYAYHIVWSDGHDTGIYTLRMLRGSGTSN